MWQRESDIYAFTHWTNSNTHTQNDFCLFVCLEALKYFLIIQNDMTDRVFSTLTLLVKIIVINKKAFHVFSLNWQILTINFICFDVCLCSMPKIGLVKI